MGMYRALEEPRAMVVSKNVLELCYEDVMK